MTSKRFAGWHFTRKFNVEGLASLGVGEVANRAQSETKNAPICRRNQGEKLAQGVEPWTTSFLKNTGGRHAKPLHHTSEQQRSRRLYYVILPLNFADHRSPSPLYWESRDSIVSLLLIEPTECSRSVLARAPGGTVS